MTDATNTPPQPTDVPPARPAPDASSPAAPPYAPPMAPPAQYGQPAYPQPTYTQPGYPQAGYGQQPYGQPGYGYAAPVRPTNVLAIISLIASIVGLTLIPFLASIAGIITGHMGLKQVSTSGENGRGLALWGTILGWIGAGFWLLLFLIWLLFIFVFAASVPALTQVS
ncbi:DUF4190 domain-containing protein [Microbacterium sp. NPDC091382]|uniref:DUF4190 domain-containing protein n=1 Tax=Microbacterium sp. NPDC091382 TaxID=3364210 RepID=UPI0037F1E822